jgi:hypothetical protein
MASDSNDVVTESVLRHHVEGVGVEIDELVESARSDGIITDTDAIKQGGERLRRYYLVGSLKDLMVYTERLSQ